MKIAVEGCCHGELDKIYETIAYLEQQEGIKVDLLLCCGDFQAVRNRSDLQCMAVPPKYQKMNTFYKYYSGEKVAPILTIFIGGNHEASNYLQELPYGGWVAPNIYYMGYANVIQFGGVRIGGLSGIYKGRDYNRGHFERPPYDESCKRSAYHIRNVDVFRLKQVKQNVDIFLSHDWPLGVWKYGNVEYLLRKKPFFREEVEAETLGSPPAAEILHRLKPDYWFSAHLHVKFAAHVQHKLSDGSNKSTKFLSLDKCLPRRQFLQVVDIPQTTDSPPQLELDPEWLAILRSTSHLTNTTRTSSFMPGPGCKERWDFTVTDSELTAIKEDFGHVFKVPDNFEQTAPIHSGNGNHSSNVKKPPRMCVNPQTTLLCQMLELVDPFAVFSGKESELDYSLERSSSALLPNPDEITGVDDDLSDDSPPDTDTSCCLTPSTSMLGNSSMFGNSSLLGTSFLGSSSPNASSVNLDTSDIVSASAANPDEISLDLEDDDPTESDSLGASAQMEELSVASLNSSGDKRKLDMSPTAMADSSSVEKSVAESPDRNLKVVVQEATPTKCSPAPKKFKRRNQSVYQEDS